MVGPDAGDGSPATTAPLPTPPRIPEEPRAGQSPSGTRGPRTPGPEFQRSQAEVNPHQDRESEDPEADQRAIAPEVGGEAEEAKGGQDSPALVEAQLQVGVFEAERDRAAQTQGRAGQQITAPD